MAPKPPARFYRGGDYIPTAYGDPAAMHAEHVSACARQVSESAQRISNLFAAPSTAGGGFGGYYTDQFISAASQQPQQNKYLDDSENEETLLATHGAFDMDAIIKGLDQLNPSIASNGAMDFGGVSSYKPANSSHKPANSNGAIDFGGVASYKPATAGYALPQPRIGDGQVTPGLTSQQANNLKHCIGNVAAEAAAGAAAGGQGLAKVCASIPRLGPIVPACAVIGATTGAAAAANHALQSSVCQASFGQNL